MLPAMLALPRGAKAQPRPDLGTASGSTEFSQESHEESTHRISGKKRDLEQNCTCPGAGTNQSNQRVAGGAAPLAGGECCLRTR